MKIHIEEVNEKGGSHNCHFRYTGNGQNYIGSTPYDCAGSTLHELGTSIRQILVLHMKPENPTVTYSNGIELNAEERNILGKGIRGVTVF